MMKGWNKIQKKYKLFQSERNCVWKTYEPVFCDLTGKQIWSGYLIATEDRIIGIYSWDALYGVYPKLFGSREYLYSRGIESMALPIKRTVRVERGKMTAALRYNILKRDKFRCKACGARAGDVELQIDHVVPVSKGGKTIESNLQALCKDCNHGKSNRH